ncbi:MAG: alpha/beta hydrolase [Gemmatimonadetes bacterium]|nr:alpha/beta hydrolase [Gemmatimonadota bacterium]NNM33872.1 alpha/beta hydrolase [Gemmatimonadota bacterium]
MTVAPERLPGLVDPEAYDSALKVSGTGPVLIYVPGIDGTGKLFYRQRPTLEPRFRVVTYRLRESAVTMDTLVDDLDRVLDAIPDSRPAWLVGESFGGALAMSYALARPASVHRLVVLNSFPHFDPQFRLRLAIMGIRLIPGPVMTMVRRLTAFRLHSPHTHRTEIRKFMQLTAATTRAGYLNRLRILRTYDLRRRLPELATPTLFLAADRDRLVPSKRQAQLMHGLVPSSECHVLSGHGHICLIAPGLLLSEILEAWSPASGRGAPSA